MLLRAPGFRSWRRNSDSFTSILDLASGDCSRSLGYMWSRSRHSVYANEYMNMLMWIADLDHLLLRFLGLESTSPTDWLIFPFEWPKTKLNITFYTGRGRHRVMRLGEGKTVPGSSWRAMNTGLNVTLVRELENPSFESIYTLTATTNGESGSRTSSQSSFILHATVLEKLPHFSSIFRQGG